MLYTLLQPLSRPRRAFAAGSFMTSLDMHGISLTLMKVPPRPAAAARRRGPPRPTAATLRLDLPALWENPYCSCKLTKREFVGLQVDEYGELMDLQDSTEAPVSHGLQLQSLWKIPTASVSCCNHPAR